MVLARVANYLQKRIPVCRYSSSWITTGKVDSVAAQENCVMKLLLYHICVNLPLMIMSYPIFKYMGFTSALSLPSWNVVCFQIFSCFILEDFIFYWGHRILHTKWLYKHVHNVHHECVSSTLNLQHTITYLEEHDSLEMYKHTTDILKVH